MQPIMNSSRWLCLPLAAACLVLASPFCSAAESELRIVDHTGDGRLEAHRNGRLLLAWQTAPLPHPAGGESFAGSAFFHPLQTPAGFCWTHIQPEDHKHHFGLWWPWKFIQVNGTSYNTWEIQNGQGAHTALTTKLLSCSGDNAEWEFQNQISIKPSGSPPEVVIRETVRVKLSISNQMQVLDLDIRQRAEGPPVTVLAYRYSGFSWRGPASWNKDNSLMLTDSGKQRDHANGTAGRWVMVSGPTPHGNATVLMMSAASTPEKLRVWDSLSQSGAPFVNFNPVMDHALPLDDAHPEVSHRRYRVIAADRALGATEAESEWLRWRSAATSNQPTPSP